MAKPFRSAERTRLFDWRTALLDSDLPSTTKLVGLVLSTHMNRSGDSCFPGTELLMKQTSLGRSAVLGHLQALKQTGWVLAVKRAGRGRPLGYLATMPDDVVDQIVATATEPSGEADSLETPEVHEGGPSEPSTDNDVSANRPPTVRDGGPPLSSTEGVEDERTIPAARQQPPRSTAPAPTPDEDEAAAAAVYYRHCTMRLNEAMAENPTLEGGWIPIASSTQQGRVSWYEDGIPLDVAGQVIHERAMAYHSTAQQRGPRSLKYFDAAVREQWERGRQTRAEARVSEAFRT